MDSSGATAGYTGAQALLVLVDLTFVAAWAGTEEVSCVGGPGDATNVTEVANAREDGCAAVKLLGAVAVTTGMAAFWSSNKRLGCISPYFASGDSVGEGAAEDGEDRRSGEQGVIDNRDCLYSSVDASAIASVEV